MGSAQHPGMRISPSGDYVVLEMHICLGRGMGFFSGSTVENVRTCWERTETWGCVTVVLVEFMFGLTPAYSVVSKYSYV